MKKLTIIYREYRKTNLREKIGSVDHLLMDISKQSDWQFERATMITAVE